MPRGSRRGGPNAPAGAAKTRAVLGLTASDLGCDPAAAQLAPVLAVVVATVRSDVLGPLARPADLAARRRDPLDERERRRGAGRRRLPYARHVVLSETAVGARRI